MPHDQPYLEAEKKIKEARLNMNHPRIYTNKRMYPPSNHKTKSDKRGARNTADLQIHEPLHFDHHDGKINQQVSSQRGRSNISILIVKVMWGI